MRPTGVFLSGTSRVVADFICERARQNAKHPETDAFPDGTSAERFGAVANAYRTLCDVRAARGDATWTDVLLEEVYEALAEADEARLREELVQVMAVAGRWIEAVDRRGAQS